MSDIATQDNTTFLALTETHLGDNILDAEINIANYTLYRTDRLERSHGGIAIYLREELAANTEILETFSNSTTEMLALYVKKMDLIIVVIYRPPNTTFRNFKEAAEKIQHLLQLLPTPLTEVILTGDFNFLTITWPQMQIHGGSRDVPTRGKNILDLLFSNNWDLIHSQEVAKPVMSDHNLIKVNTNWSLPKRQYKDPNQIQCNSLTVAARV